MGVLAPVCSGESRPTLKFAGSVPATAAIEDAFKMALDNLIDINSIPYDRGKWNDTGLLETAADSRFLRAVPAYGDNPWVHDGAHNTWSAMNLLEANDGRATRVARNTLWACCDMEDGKLVVNIQQSAHSEWYMYQLWNIAAWHYYLVTGDTAFLAKAYEAATRSEASRSTASPRPNRSRPLSCGADKLSPSCWASAPSPGRHPSAPPNEFKTSGQIGEKRGGAQQAGPCPRQTHCGRGFRLCAGDIHPPFAIRLAVGARVTGSSFRILLPSRCRRR